MLRAFSVSNGRKCRLPPGFVVVLVPGCRAPWPLRVATCRTSGLTDHPGATPRRVIRPCRRRAVRTGRLVIPHGAQGKRGTDLERRLPMDLTVVAEPSPALDGPSPRPFRMSRIVLDWRVRSWRSPQQGCSSTSSSLTHISSSPRCRNCVAIAERANGGLSQRAVATTSTAKPACSKWFSISEHRMRFV